MTTTNKVKPVVGMGATVRGYSDAHAATIVYVGKTGALLQVQYDKATLLNGVNSGEPDALKFIPGGFVGHTSGVQRYAFERMPDVARQTFTLRKNGSWVRQGEPMKNGTRLTVGVRSHHYDFNF